jgi:serine/threonine protein kinase
MALETGRRLGPYEIEGVLGAGGMGEVYRARDPKLEREVAIKVLPEHFADDEERLRRFEREARALASLNHPNVAQIHGVDQVDGTCFLVLEFVPGQTLGELLSRGPLPVAQAIDVCRRIAAGLEAAHEAGVIHRDLTPDNVRVTPGNEVKLLDFGLARGIEGPGSGLGVRQESGALTTEEGRLLGTPSYMAPEQARGHAVDRRVDVWALGCVLFECLAGRRPFEGATASDVIAAVLEREPDLSHLPASTPPRLRELIERCLRKDTRVRLRDAGDAQVLLEECAAGTDDATSRAPVRRGVPAPMLLVAVLVGAVVGWLVTRPSPDDAPPLPVAITTSQYLDENPTWNPDGTWIAFTRMTSGSNDIWLKDLTSGHERLRRGGPGDQHAPAWSPKGDYIAYVTTDRPGTPIMLMPPHEEGSRGERELIDTGARTFDSARYSGSLGSRPWSNDGKSLLVSRNTGDGTIAVFRVGRDDDSIEQLTFPPTGMMDLTASHSFDGTRIAFVRISLTKGPIMTMPAEGGEPEVLVEDVTNDAEPCWTPDGESLLFIHSADCSTSVLRYDLADGSTKQLVIMPRQAANNGLSISADGRVAYAAGWHDTSLVSHELATGELHWLNQHTLNNYAPRYSPSGSEVAYHSNRTGDPEIWVREADGVERRITRDPAADYGPDW